MAKQQEGKISKTTIKSDAAVRAKFVNDCNNDPDLEGFEGSKRYFLYALKLCKGNITNAAKMINMSRRSHYIYCDEDPEYLERAGDIIEFVIDYVEDKLMGRINNNDTTAMIFWLKCKGKKRGWVDKLELDHTTKGESMNKTLANMTDEELLAKLNDLNERMK